MSARAGERCISTLHRRDVHLARGASSFMKLDCHHDIRVLKPKEKLPCLPIVFPSLTRRAVDAIKANGKDTVYWDGKLTGFGLRVRKSGCKRVLRANSSQWQAALVHDRPRTDR